MHHIKFEGGDTFQIIFRYFSFCAIFGPVPKDQNPKRDIYEQIPRSNTILMISCDAKERLELQYHLQDLEIGVFSTAVVKGSQTYTRRSHSNVQSLESPPSVREIAMILSSRSRISMTPLSSHGGVALRGILRGAVASTTTASSSSSFMSTDAASTSTSTWTSVAAKKSLVTRNEGVHQTVQVSKAWKNKPLFRRQGDVRFKTGLEAANLLVAEANRRDAHEIAYIDTVRSTMQCLSPIFERNPRYAFVAKQLMEPERYLQFRVAWIDDTGVGRSNRGYRIQYSSSVGPYEGSLHFGHHVNSSVIKALGFDTVFSNALTGFGVGAAVGGSDINPYDKSESEMQRFCQSYMTELAKYVGPDLDLPTMGMGVGEKEAGYLLGQYKRINMRWSSGGRHFINAYDSHVSF